ncbi:MAG: nuclear transport factor 2 family protein [Bacteroidota bacterium]|nr:nuclear transport factor 2 family protein [Bacteroidota bacterium]
MNENERLISDFYTCLQCLDWRGVNSFYHADATFYDPVFENLEKGQVTAMWEMLLSGAREFRLDFAGVHADGEDGGCTWTAYYSFSRTGRRVVNKGKAHFRFVDGKIAEHQDEFSLWAWSRQALGLPGLLFGWTSPMHRKIRDMARKSLDKFINRSTYVRPS